MNDMSLTREEREAKLEGMGCKRKRVEDIRFTQGKGNYVDDVKLPGMLHGDFVRSPHAHARVKSINSEKALKVPGVLAVITAETLKTVNLAWMPTLAGDVQMVLADGKVLFQNQEVAFVVATDRYAADDGVAAVEVEYEPLPVLIDPFKALDPDAPLLREDINDKKDGAHGPRKHHNHIFEWTVGDRGLTDAAFNKAEVTIKEMISYHRTHPSPLETCQCVCSFDKVKGELTIWGTFQAPHVIRTVVSLIAKLPEQKIHVIAPDIGGGFGNKVGAYPGYICAAVASIVTGKPAITSKISMKSLRCSGSNLSSATRRPASSAARIIWRTAVIRAASKNICSVRHSPTPSAPKSRAVRQSSGVSALARTLRRRTASTHSIKVPKSPASSGWIVATSPAITCRMASDNCSCPAVLSR